MKTTRRKFITSSMIGAAGLSVSLKSLAAPGVEQVLTPPPAKAGAFSVSIFSKTLHWLDYEAMAQAVAAMGFDGIDLTVRPAGHVTPEKVAEDLPKAHAAITKAGLKIYMITTSIVKADDPFTETILKAASSLGIGYYRMGWIQYDEKLNLEDNLKEIKKQMAALAVLNKKYNISAQYQNHSGVSFGAPMWDLGMILKEINSPWIGSQYDILHATVEGANSWPLGFKLVSPYVGTMDIKDFHWANKNGQWKEEDTPLGEGMVDYKQYFALIKKYQVQGPFSMHFEYPLGGAENGAKVITMPKEEVLAAMKKDLVTFRKWLSDEGLK